MINKKVSLLLISLAVTPLMFMGCKNHENTEETTADTFAPVVDTTPVEDTVAEIEPEPVATPAPVQRATVKKEPEKAEVLYISGNGANGRVWGHITMKGNKGTGTVTDEHENALAVTCTRQGEELICYDQNSRQYIFRP